MWQGDDMAITSAIIGLGIMGQRLLDKTEATKNFPLPA
jgi:hypothetical protein